jgi:hypothetical protein
MGVFVTSPTGRLLIAMQGAVEKLNATDEDRAAFCHHLANTCEEGVRQAFLTWQANRATEGDLEQARQIDKAKRGAV